MRKSDKLKNFKKANLLVENRYLESKGIITESFNEIDETPIQENNEMDLETNPRLLDSIVSQISDIVAPYVGLGVGDKTISNHNLEAILTAFNQRFSRSSKFQDEFGKEYSKTPNLDEENVFSRAGKKVKDFGNRLLDITSKEEEAKKQKAIDEIINFNFKSLFFQPVEGQVLKAEIAKQKIDNAANAMPTVKELNPILFEIRGDYFSNATMEIGGKLYRGVIPSCFESIRDVNDEITNEEAIKRMIGFLG